MTFWFDGRKAVPSAAAPPTVRHFSHTARFVARIEHL
jgi:hypothetical protein